MPVVFSTERDAQSAYLEPVAEAAASAADYAVLPAFRASAIPVIGMLPAMFGCALAAYAVNALARVHADYDGVADEPSEKLCADIHARLCAHNARAFGGPQALALSRADVAFCVRDMFAARSAGPSRSLRGLALTRWDREGATELDNLVLLTAAEARRHDAAPDAAARDALYGDAQCAWIASRLALGAARMRQAPAPAEDDATS